MSEIDHELCRYLLRDQAVRAAEDAAAVPAIMHRDLPEVVAALTERVAELTTKHNALADLARLDAGWLKANEQRLTAERDAAIRERDEARAECKMLLAERDEATGRCKMMLDRVAELEGAAAPAANAGGEQQEPVAWAELLGRLAEWDHMTTAADGPYWIGEIKKVLSGAAAPLEAAVTPKSVSLSNAEGLRTERVTLEVTQRTESYAPLSEFDWTAMLRSACRGRLFDGESVRVVDEPAEIALLTAERDLARAVRDGLRSQRDAAIRERDAARARVAELEANANTATILAKIRDSEWSVASELAAEANAELSAAPPPRGWLTAEERALIESLRATFEQNADTLRPQGLGGHVDNCKRRVRLLTAILARETPPKVKVPTWIHEDVRRCVIAAIRAAGGEVE